MSGRFSLTIGPAKMLAPPGKTIRTEVFNTGKTNLHVSMRLTEIERIHGRCVVTGRPVNWAHSSPASFSVPPGGHQIVSVAVSGPVGAHPALGQLGTPHGTRDLAIAATTQLGHSGNVRLSGAVATQGLARFPGRSHMRPCLSLSGPASSGVPLGLIIGAAVAAALLGTLAWWLRRRHNRSKTDGLNRRKVAA